MKTLYIECKMGVAGDMLTAALISLFDDVSQKEKELNNIGIPNVEFVLEDSSKCGVCGKHMKVLVKGQEEPDSYYVHEHEHLHDYEHAHEHEHSHEETHHHHNKLYDIEDIIENLNLSKEIKSDIREVFQLLAEAESKVHGEPVSEIHFHEVGNYDAIADITAVCYLMHELDIDKELFDDDLLAISNIDALLRWLLNRYTAQRVVLAVVLGISIDGVNACRLIGNTQDTGSL
mgnify:CR=1 FL=1